MSIMTCLECGKDWFVEIEREGVAYICASHVQDMLLVVKPGLEGRIIIVRAMAALSKKHGKSGVSLLVPPEVESNGS